MSYIYSPTHQYQLVSTDKYGKYNCTAYAFAMLVDATTHGGVKVTGKWVRANSNEPIPDPSSPGLNIPQIAQVARGLHITLESWTGRGWDDVLKAIDEGRYVLLQGKYGAIPDQYSCQPNFDLGHAVLVTKHYKDGPNAGMMAVHDPLCKGAKRIPAKIMRRYAETLYTGVYFAVSRKVQPLSL